MTEPTDTTRWDLSDLIADPVEPTLEAGLTDLRAKVAAFVGRRPELTDDIAPATFFAMLHEYEAIQDLGTRLSAYPQLWFTEDTQNPAAMNMRDRVEAVLTDLGNQALFFELWIKQAPDATADRLISAAGEYRYYLQNLRNFRPHTLAESEEQIINLKDANGVNALVNIYDMVTGRLSFDLTIDGETRTLTRDQMASFFRHPSPDVRAATYQELYRVYGDNSTLLAQIYNHRVRDWKNEGELRHFSQPISTRNLANDLPDAVVDTLLEVCRANNGLFQRYFRLKAGWIGMDKLRRYDIYAPLTRSDKQFAYGAAVEMVLDSFDSFSPEAARLVQRVFTSNHIDSQVRPGKRGGAFCAGISPSLVPWVLMSYNGNARDVATLAHELGHALHGLLAAERSPLTFHPTLPMAETASVFSEMILTDRLLSEEKDPAVRRELLAAALDDAYATVQRQAYFTLFEREAHRLVAEGATVDDLCTTYLANLGEQFGESVVVSDDFKWEWIAIPHFYHYPFYTYAYSFGQLLVLSLFRQYQREGDPFVPRFIKLLAYGGSESPEKVLTEAGYDIATPEFWQGGYDVLAEMLADLEAL